MPNWACNHIVASGDLEQLRALAQTLNTMPNYSNGFGRYWMGNLAAALLGVDADGLDRYRGMHLRGTLDPDFYAQACLCGPYVDQKREFEVDEDGRMRFSTTSAWDRSEDLENLILEKFPRITLAWSCTDEFGNFHTTHNPERLPDLDVIAFNGCQYSRNDLIELKRDLKEECPGLGFDEDADMDYFLSEEFINLYGEWSRDFISEEEDVWAPCLEIYEEA
ncbi:MAG: hypothetical protein ACI3Y8_09280 [Candidatus Cryptobacteroides sp.]